jgi:NIMA-interacting peptidyl-prolyl cis-trans isomerase 1
MLEWKAERQSKLMMIHPKDEPADEDNAKANESYTEGKEKNGKQQKKISFEINSGVLDAAMLAIPEGWEERVSRLQSNGRVYYLNKYTRESQWKMPTHPAERWPKGEKVQASHLLVKHRDSRRPTSWRELNITRTKEEALEIVEGYRAQIESGDVSLEDLASKYSDCSSAKWGGKLGPFRHGEMQKLYEDAAFGLKVGELSKPVFTNAGVLIIRRTR